MNQQNKNEKLLFIGILFSMFMWGLSWPSGKVAAGYGAPMTVVLIRYVVVLISFIPIFMFMKAPLLINKKGVLPLLIAGLLLSLYTYLFFFGLKNGLAGAGGVLVTTMNPIMAYGLGLIINRKKPTRNESIGLLLGILAGASLLKLWGNLDELFASGNLYFLLAAFVWAVMSRITSTASKYGSSFSFSLWMYVATIVIVIPFVDLSDFTSLMQHADGYFWWNIVFSALFATSLATTYYFYATTALGPEKASSFIFLVPVSAALSAWLFLGEALLPHTIIGGILGIAAVYMINRKKS
ncbi:DMT family transporter [uncultured Cytophaga sp.]|uniref:DMT family transporter n=1 Tax=uncultured Cytophaga sp. TaxID=160238 RepID=UPI0026381FCB|nr:DMT family transporter [uncultured Cytophaga sp.]